MPLANLDWIYCGFSRQLCGNGYARRLVKIRRTALEFHTTWSKRNICNYILNKRTLTTADPVLPPGASSLTGVSLPMLLES